MHKDAKLKFDDNEAPFANAIPIYFESRLDNRKYDGLFKAHPGKDPARFYAKRLFTFDINTNFLWYMSGWNDCFAHNLLEANAVPLQRTLLEYTQLFLLYYTSDAKSQLEIIKKTHEGLVRQSEFLSFLNHDGLQFKNIYGVLKEIYDNRPIYAYPAIEMCRVVIQGMPGDNKAVYYDFADKTYSTEAIIDGDEYTYNEYGSKHLPNEWVPVVGPKSAIDSHINSPTKFKLSVMIDEYNIVVEKFKDVLDVYERVHKVMNRHE